MVRARVLFMKCLVTHTDPQDEVFLGEVYWGQGGASYCKPVKRI